MTEQEWLQATDPRPMLQVLHGREHDRKRRLFAAASSRRVAHLLLLPPCGPLAASDTSAHFVVRDVARLSARHSCWYVAWFAAYVGDDMPDGREGEWKRQAALLRDIIGNPFHPVLFDPAWLTWHDGLLVSMARQMYDSRDFTDMPILADALEEAGCSDQDILSHSRSGGEHFRGCWVIDLLLGKK